MLKIFRAATVGLLALVVVAQVGSDRLRASASGIVISQVYGGGGNSGATLKNDFIELFNAGGSAIDVTGWTVQYASAAGSSWQKTALAGVIQPGHYYLVQEAAGSGGTVALPTPDATGAIAMAAGAGKVALVNTSTTLTGTCPSGAAVVDFVGFGSTANCYEGSGPTGAPSNTMAALRNANGCTDTDSNVADFAVAAPNPRNASSTANACAAPTNPAIGAAPISAVQGDTVLLSVSVTPGNNPVSTGIQVTANLTAIGGAAAQPLYDDGMHGDVTAGDLVFSLSIAGPPPGTYQLAITATDAQARTASQTLELRVMTLTAIHDVQGPALSSPYAGQVVTLRGIVTGVKSNGFFIQAPDAEADANPDTSEGVYVFTSSKPGAAVAVGNEVTVTGKVQEYVPSGDPFSPPMTEISGSPTVSLVSTGNDLPAPIPLSASDLNAAQGIQKLERYEGMRVHVDALVSTGPTGGSLAEANATSTSNGMFVGVLPGTGRPFREAGIEPPNPVPDGAISPATVPIWDGNPERIAVDTDALATSSALNVTTGVQVENLTGPLDYTYRMYVIDTETTPVQTTANADAQPVRARTNDEFTVATMNLERFYDTTNDGATSDAVLTQAAYDMRLAKASKAIREAMLAPDIVGVEEMENLATLQALAAKVYDDSNGAVDYAAYLFEGNDIGGIDVGLLVRKDKVAVDSVEQYGKDSTYVEPNGTTAMLNDRPSLILHGAILNTPYDAYPVTVLVNHLRSMSGIEGADGDRIRAKRLAQAVDLGARLQALQTAGDHVISVGDYNAFDVNDGYVDVIGYLKGTEADANHVTLWAASPVTPPLFDAIDLAQADQRYSYVFDGNAQEIDHILVSSGVQANAVAYARINADFPEILRGDATRPERLSDHDPVVGYFSLPDIDKTAPALTLPASSTVEGNALGGAIVTYTASAYDAVDGNVTPVCAPASGALFPLGATTVTCTAVDAHGNRASGTFTVTVVDTTAPLIDAVMPSTVTLWAPNHTLVPVSIGVKTTDAVDATPSCAITDVTADDGAAADDWQITGPLTLNLRAERTGGGNRRTYTIGIACTDASGNAATPTTTAVFVPHDQRK